MAKNETITPKQSTSLYEAQQKIYSREVKGKFQSLRMLSMCLLLGLYYLVPWLSWGERQAVLFDLPARKFHIFALTLWPQDFFFLTLLLIIAGLSLFFFTALAGRIWCGYACPQTVWTEAFIWMERLTEGSRNKQIQLDKAPWSLLKVRKKLSKQILWGSFSLWTGLTFVGYFTPIQTLISGILSWQLSGWESFWILFYSLATYGNAGFLREQVCQYMCPYARFQSAMFDSDTLIIAYDQDRGEPRARGAKRKQGNVVGDCIDCSLCVQVCPTGIDIRDGLQYECIACAACIDVCDQVMDSVGRPRNLISYTTESETSKTLSTILLRPRILIYAGLLGIACIGFVTALLLRSELQVDILRDRNALYRMISNNTIENIYHIKVMNKSHADQYYQVTVTGLDNATAQWVTSPGGKSTPEQSNLVPAGSIGDFTASIHLPEKSQQQRNQTVYLRITELNGKHPQSVTEETRFWGPEQLAD
ncbi:MAG: cytochrome c oxidase accessory protein CcoG [Arenicella sp.]